MVQSSSTSASSFNGHSRRRELEALAPTPLLWRAVEVSHPLDPAPRRTGCDVHLDPYVGCADGCAFCRARSFAEGILALGARVELPALLPLALRRDPSIRIRVGGRCDPYPPLESSLRLTRACLGALVDARTRAPESHAVELCTRSQTVLEDLDLLRALGASITVGLSTCSRATAQALEPQAPPVRERLDLVEQLQRAGLDVGVELYPILPGLGDDRRSLRRVVCAAANAGAAYVRGSLLRVGDEARRALLDWIREVAPEQVPRYRRLYGARGDRRRRRDAELEAAERVACTLSALRHDYRLAADPLWPTRREPRPRLDAGARQFDLFEAA